MVAAPQPPPENTLLGGSAIAFLACEISGWYAVVLRDGTCITFQKMELSGEWIRLHGAINKAFGSELQNTSVDLRCIEVRRDDVRLITGAEKP